MAGRRRKIPKIKLSAESELLYDWLRLMGKGSLLDVNLGDFHRYAEEFTGKRIPYEKIQAAVVELCQHGLIEIQAEILRLKLNNWNPDQFDFSIKSKD